MNYMIDRSSTVPAYLQLYRLLVEDIVSGRRAFGDRLPSKRMIAEETGVSVITAEHAIALLCEEGYAETRLRSGTFVAYKGEDFPGGAAAAPRTGESSAAVPRTSEFPFTVLARTMRRVLQDYGEKILVKSPSRGCPELIREICLYLGRSRGFRVAPSRVVVGSGAEYLYGLIVQLLGTDAPYAIEDPSYGRIRDVYEAMGARCRPLPLTPEGIATESLENTDARILHVTPFNSYPSGITATISKKHEYLRWARRRGGILIEDNYDSELNVSRKPEEPLCAMEPDADVIYLNTFSRTVAPSMRIGYMILPENMTAAFDEKLGFYSCTVPVFDQYVLAELLRSGDFERHINRVRRRRRKGQPTENAPERLA